MAPEQHLIILYLLFWIVRVQGCVRRGRQPRLRGPEWFFNVPVAPGFYDGPGARLLRGYWLRMLIPFAIDMPFAIYIFATGHLLWLVWLIVGLSALIHVNHLVSVNIAERHAQRYAAPAADAPVVRLAVSLQPRRLRDYVHPRMELAIAVALCAGIVSIVFLYLTGRTSGRVALGVPLVIAYAQGGLLFVKRVILEWRRPVPEDQADEYLEASEQTRRFYLLICDWYRLTLAVSMAVWPIRLLIPPARVDVVMTIWFAAWLALALVLTVWVEIKRKRLVDLKLRARPVRLPDLLHPSGARWPVCYQPSAPMLMVRGARGYSLNLANTLAQGSAAYLAGLVVLIALLRMVR
jgi:hypothetical protein